MELTEITRIIKDIIAPIVKDLVVIATPIVVAVITHKGNKKSKKDIQLEIEKIKSEKSAETNQMLQKIYGELESQKQLISWQNSIPQTNEYQKLIDIKRYGNISTLANLCSYLNGYLNNNPSLDDLIALKDMLKRIELSTDKEELYPYELPYILNYRAVQKQIDLQIDSLSRKSDAQGDNDNANT